MPLRKPPPPGTRRSESVSKNTGRRPTLTTIRTPTPPRPGPGPIIILDGHLISPSSSTRSGHSFYVDAPSQQLIDEEEEESRPFNTLKGLCREAGESYPPPQATSPSLWEIRSGVVAYDNEYNHTTTLVEFMGYDDPPSSIREGSMTYITYVDDENPLMRFKRRASTVGDAVGGFVKSIRRTSGSLRRSVSKAFGFNNVQEVTRIGNGERKGFMAGEETDNEATGPEFGEVVWNRVHREI